MSEQYNPNMRYRAKWWEVEAERIYILKEKEVPLSSPYEDCRTRETAADPFNTYKGDPGVGEARWRGRRNGMPFKEYVYKGSGKSDPFLDSEWKDDPKHEPYVGEQQNSRPWPNERKRTQIPWSEAKPLSAEASDSES
jgi:hypothetical protein